MCYNDYPIYNVVTREENKCIFTTFKLVVTTSEHDFLRFFPLSAHQALNPILLMPYPAGLPPSFFSLLLNKRGLGWGTNSVIVISRIVL